MYFSVSKRGKRQKLWCTSGGLLNICQQQVNKSVNVLKLYIDIQYPMSNICAIIEFTGQYFILFCIFGRNPTHHVCIIIVCNYPVQLSIVDISERCIYCICILFLFCVVFFFYFSLIIQSLFSSTFDSRAFSWSVQTWQWVNTVYTGGKPSLWVPPSLCLCFSKG